jgi:hypothetical protein
MKLALIVIGAIIGTVITCALIAVAIGSRLAPNHTASRTLELKRKPGEVYAVIRRFADAATWRSDIKRVELIGSDKFKEYGSNGTITYQIVEDLPDHKIVTRIVDLDLGYSGSWEYLLESAGEGTVVTITERGVVSNPFFRFMSRYVFGQTATIDTYLKKLKARMS